MAVQDVVGRAKKVLLIGAFGLLLCVGGYGACTQYVGTIHIPLPNSDPTPIPKPQPTDVWQPLNIPAKNVVDGLELPKPMKVAASSKYVIIQAKCNNEVHWTISTKSGNPVTVLQSKLINSVMLFTSDMGSDTVAVLAYSAVNNKATDTAITFVEITEGGPTPPNPPNPPTPPDAVLPKTLHVTYWLDLSKPSQATANILASADLRQWLESGGHEVHELSVKDDLSKYNLTDITKGKQPPLLILQVKQGGNVAPGTAIYSETLTSVQAVKDAVTKHTSR